MILQKFVSISFFTAVISLITYPVKGYAKALEEKTLSLSDSDITILFENVLLLFAIVLLIGASLTFYVALEAARNQDPQKVRKFLTWPLLGSLIIFLLILVTAIVIGQWTLIFNWLAIGVGLIFAALLISLWLLVSASKP